MLFRSPANGKLLPPREERGGSIVTAVLECLRGGVSGSSINDFNSLFSVEEIFLDVPP